MSPSSSPDSFPPSLYVLISFFLALIFIIYQNFPLRTAPRYTRRGTRPSSPPLRNIRRPLPRPLSPVNTGRTLNTALSNNAATTNTNLPDVFRARDAAPLAPALFERLLVLEAMCARQFEEVAAQQQVLRSHAQKQDEKTRVLIEELRREREPSTCPVTLMQATGAGLPHPYNTYSGVGVCSPYGSFATDTDASFDSTIGGSSPIVVRPVMLRDAAFGSTTRDFIKRDRKRKEEKELKRQASLERAADPEREDELRERLYRNGQDEFGWDGEDVFEGLHGRGREAQARRGVRDR
ncbi:hypothetical protein BU16DRAFT_542313 [Lophium mytilinum]|uniref:Uncharacterized protein n=1 Tax=Lophium mytilinum TaxID=390894 RepID=A0A6A6QK66_9PEZI|nr:hypothetical protein BU16DRAFT_542313 [Lophium mytilinum]